MRKISHKSCCGRISQAPVFDFKATFASVIWYESLRLLVAICARNQSRPQPFDVKSTFLYRKLKEEVYRRPPPGFSDRDKVWKLNRCIYGLMQSATNGILCSLNSWHSKILPHHTKTPASLCTTSLNATDHFTWTIWTYIQQIPPTGQLLSET